MGNAMGNTVQRLQLQKTNPKEVQTQEKENQNGSKSQQTTCEICIEPMSSINNFNSTDRCVHPFCKDCMAKYIQIKVEDDAAAVVECPGLNCKQLLDPFSCRHLMSQQVFDKWCDNLCEAAILGFDRCYCPYKDCSALVVNECSSTADQGILLKRSECPNCRKFFCFQCKIPWHAGYRCEDSGEVRDTNDALFGQLVESKNWIRCPQCGYIVERIRGCNNVICRCKTSFCYQCGKKLSEHDGSRPCRPPPPPPSVALAIEQVNDGSPRRSIETATPSEVVQACLLISFCICCSGYVIALMIYSLLRWNSK